MAKRRVRVTYVGILMNVMEQGLEHSGYALKRDGHDKHGWDGVELIDDGDHLVVYGRNGDVLYRGKIKIIFSPDGPLTQKGVDWKVWQSYFYSKVPYRAELTKLVSRNKKK